MRQQVVRRGRKVSKTPFGTRLQQARQRAGLKQEEVARKFGVRQGTVSSWEHGEREPSADTIARLARLYGVTADWLLGLDIGKSPVEVAREIRSAAYRWARVLEETARQAEVDSQRAEQLQERLRRIQEMVDQLAKLPEELREEAANASRRLERPLEEHEIAEITRDRIMRLVSDFRELLYGREWS